MIYLATPVLFLVAGIGLALVLRVRAQERELLGEPVTVELVGRPRRVVTALLVVLLLAVFLWVERADLARAAGLAVPPVLGVLLVHFLRPAAHDRVLGTRGLRCGWWVLSFEELPEWRLMGDHLRFYARREWQAVHAPAELHAELLPVLRSVAGDRESTFNQ